MAAYKCRIYIDEQVSSEWMHGKRWQLLNNKCILIFLLLKHRTKHIVRLMAETCSVLVLVHFDCIHSAARLFTHENHRRTGVRIAFFIPFHSFRMHLAVSRFLLKVKQQTNKSNNKIKRTKRKTKRKKKHSTKIPTATAKKNTPRRLFYTEHVFNIYKHLAHFFFRLFHSKSDKLYTKCKQMNWVHVNRSYCLVI